ncbi:MULTISPECIES: rubredoxin [unclassified Methanobrevibacter]|jgi:rubredoxin|uniref:rubredoxin n=1 Tax=unclassified Methanobrevibacter TaxID=2638681 RepID=UPI0039B8AA43
MMCECRYCSYIYLSDVGAPAFGIEPGTLPKDFPLQKCPYCNSPVNIFYICYDR